MKTLVITINAVCCRPFYVKSVKSYNVNVLLAQGLSTSGIRDGVKHGQMCSIYSPITDHTPLNPNPPNFIVGPPEV